MVKRAITRNSFADTFSRVLASQLQKSAHDDGTVGFRSGPIARAVYADLEEECGPDEARIFLVADALLTEATLAPQAKRAEALAQAKAEASDRYVMNKRAAAFSRNPKKR